MMTKNIAIVLATMATFVNPTLAQRTNVIVPRLHVWDTTMRSNRPIVKHVRRSVQGEKQQLIEICEYLNATYVDSLATQLWKSRSGSTVEAELIVHNAKWIKLHRNGRAITVDNHKLSDESRTLVERLNDLREVRRLYRKYKGQIDNNVASAIEKTRELIEERFGNLDAVQLEMVVAGLITRATLGEYQTRDLTLRMMVAEHFAAIISEASGTKVSARDVNRKLMLAGTLETTGPRVVTNNFRRVPTGFNQTITDNPTRQFRAVDVNRTTVVEYIDAMIDVMVEGAGEKAHPVFNKTDLPTPILD